MNRQSHLDAFERMMEIANRNYLYQPFKNNALRAKHFPGAGAHIGRKKLIEAYAREFVDANADEKLLQHGIGPWIHGYDDSLAQITDDLKQHQDNPPDALPTDRLRDLEKRFTKQGADEIAAFWTIYAAGDTDYRQAVIDQLADIKPPEMPTGPPKLQTPLSPAPEAHPTSTEPQPDPAAQSAYALFGALIFFVPSLLLIGIQYWRQPEQSHWIIISIAAIFGLITLIFFIDFLRKRNA